MLRPTSSTCHGQAAVNVIGITGCRVRVCGARTASWPMLRPLHRLASLAMVTAMRAGAQLFCSRQPHKVLSPFD